jgi:hypothetical protein
MKRLIFAAAALILVMATPAFALVNAAPISAAGITPAEMANVMTQYGWTAKLGKASDGSPIITSQAAGATFYVYFYECHDGRCSDIQFAASWSNAVPPRFTLDRVNGWNRTHRFVRAYLSPGNLITASLDARIAYGTTANVQEYLGLWRTVLGEFKSSMGL